MEENVECKKPKRGKNVFFQNIAAFINRFLALKASKQERKKVNREKYKNNFFSRQNRETQQKKESNEQ